MGINQFTFTGAITKAFEAPQDKEGRSFLRFHVDVSCGPMGSIWVCAEVRKKKLIADIEECLWAGNEVTVAGSLAPRDRDQTGPIIVLATDVRPHNVIVEIVDDGRDDDEGPVAYREAEHFPEITK